MYKKKHILILSIIILTQVFLIFFSDIKFFDIKELNYYYTSENFSKMRWSITDREYLSQRIVSGRYQEKYNIGDFDGYKMREDGFYVSHMQAGYPLVLAVFHYFNNAQILNIIILILLIFAIYYIPNDFFNIGERFYIGVFTAISPILLISSSRVYMPDFFAFALSVIGFSLFFCVVSYNKNRIIASSLSFLSGLCFMLSSFSNSEYYVNIVLIIIFFFVFYKKFDIVSFFSSILCFLLGFTAILSINLIYNHKILFDTLNIAGDIGMRSDFFNHSAFISLMLILKTFIESLETVLISIPFIIFAPAGIFYFNKNKDKRILILLLLVFSSGFGILIQSHEIYSYAYIQSGLPYLLILYPMTIFAGTLIYQLRFEYKLILLITLLFIGFCIYFNFIYTLSQDPFNLGISNIWHLEGQNINGLVNK